MRGSACAFESPRLSPAIGCVLLALFLSLPAVAAERLTLPGIKGPDQRLSVEAVDFPWSCESRKGVSFDYVEEFRQ